VNASQKKPVKTEITELQNKKTKNCLLSSCWNLIGRIKVFRVASDRFRLARHKYEQVIRAFQDQLEFGRERVY